MRAFLSVQEAQAKPVVFSTGEKVERTPRVIAVPESQSQSHIEPNVTGTKQKKKKNKK